ncbi:LysR family transcriptional regulator [Psychromarinibacter sp. C21-152]|uniref:LysR family transcriptional regulator n=1 Tax=Psychromarinibacter sediminicola TaxID=3033385 RepID=A0AAE3NU03_9RHOB|nr:LysR family transcriptional regulator [Psychromarinibacter sediminicola]MDF0601634.1 LysR family transcriptional regulator [Psychromarinibacter sediminicola]
MEKPSLADLEAFAVVAAERSFRRAADLMGVSRSALSHRMKKLEQQVGLRLLNRTTRSVSPTDAGSRLLKRIEPVLRNLDSAIDTLADERGTPSGVLRINADKGGARMMLRHVMPTYLERYPDVEIDLVCDGRLVDIVEQGFDAGIRLAEAVPQDMIAVRLSDDFRFLAVASPDYLNRFGKPDIPDDLRNHRCIRQRLPSGKRYRWEFEKRGQEIALDPPGTLTLNDNDLIAEAAIRSLGIAYVPETAACEHLAAGRLVAVLDDWCPPDSGLVLYYPGHRHVPAALRALIDLVKEIRSRQSTE